MPQFMPDDTHRVPPRPAGPRLAISLWDFSWYTQAGPGEPFADLAAAFDQLVERGFNTIRICAMPFLLFSGQVPADDELTVTGLGDDYGQGTRWYTVRGGYTLRPLARLEELFTEAIAHDVRVIVSSWEYQQSACFVTSDVWFRALDAVPGPERASVMATCLSRLVAHLDELGLARAIAYVELHNEVDNCSLVPASPDSHPGHYARLDGPLSAGLDLFRAQRPDTLVTYSIRETWPQDMGDLPPAQVAHFHFYVYGVLGALYEAVGLGHGTSPRPDHDQWPTPTLAGMLRADAPDRDDYRPRSSWQSEATGIDHDLFYVHDWVEPDAWDLWMYEHYQEHRLAMEAQLSDWTAAVASLAGRWGVPAVLGEGVVGYTPLRARFEEDPVGRHLADHTVRACLDAGFWGVMPTSNAAPHHPMWWTDVAWMRSVNDAISHTE